MMFEVALNAPGLGLEEGDVQLRALVSVSDGALEVCGGPVETARS